jgi:hypothetical protein
MKELSGQHPRRRVKFFLPTFLGPESTREIQAVVSHLVASHRPPNPFQLNSSTPFSLSFGCNINATAIGACKVLKQALVHHTRRWQLLMVYLLAFGRDRSA